MSSAQSQTTQSTRRQRIKANLQKVGQKVQKLNLARLIDEMERDQELADQLETVNVEVKEEMKRKALVREAVARCHEEIEKHLDSFLRIHPDGTYEEWIRELHPENVQQGKILDDLWVIDERFYVESSDHRKLWNERRPSKQIAARSFMNHSKEPSIDLLDDRSERLEDVDLSRGP